MMAKNTVLSSSESRILCDVCQQNDIDDNDIPIATHYCTDCNENQCSKCSKFHGKLNASKDHKLVTIDDILVRKVDLLELFEEDCYQNNMTQTEQQEHLEDPVHNDFPSDAQELVKKGSDCGIENENLEQKLEESRKEIKNLAQELQESRKETAETGEQNIILKESFDKALLKFESLERKFEEFGNKNLEQELQESRKRIAEMNEQNRILKENIDKALRFEPLKRKFELENKNLEQELQESRKETAEMKEQCRMLEENLDKALHREKNLTKELDASLKSRSKSDIFGNLQEALATTSESSSQQQRSHTTSSSESSKLFESKVFVFGIDDGVLTKPTKDTIKINLNQSNDVSKARKMPVEMIQESAAAVHCDSIFVTGLGKKINEIWRFSATSSKWNKCASLVQSRRRHSVAFVDHILYICGGWVRSENKTLDDVEAYDTLKDKCVAVGKLVNANRSSGNCVPFNSSLYIFGGLDANDKIVVNKVQVYDTKMNTCTLLSKPLSRAHYLLRAVLWENTVILLGYFSCFTYNFETEVWKATDQFKTDVYHFGLTISNGLVFVIGGRGLIKDSYGNKKWIHRVM